jgi:hypothetical protein
MPHEFAEEVPSTPTKKEWTDVEYLRETAAYYNQPLVPDLYKHYSRLTQIADRLAKLETDKILENTCKVPR